MQINIKQKLALSCINLLRHRDILCLGMPLQQQFSTDVATLQIRCLPPKASQEDGNHTTFQIRLYLLRKDDCEETLCWHLGLQGMQEDRRWRSLHPIVRSLESLRIKFGRESYQLGFDKHYYHQYWRC